MTVLFPYADDLHSLKYILYLCIARIRQLDHLARYCHVRFWALFSIPFDTVFKFDGQTKARIDVE